ncbi:MAG: hypothetical protein WDM84_05615 [Bauldia sp.]
MLAYQAGLKPGSTRLVISPDSEFFRFFGNSLAAPCRRPSSPATAAISPAATPKPAATPAEARRIGAGPGHVSGTGHRRLAFLLRRWRPARL